MKKLSEMYDKVINLYAQTKVGYNRPSLASSFISIKKYDPMYSITPNKSSVDEGTVITFNINSFNVKNGTTVYYKVTDCSASDFIDDSLTGSCVINNNTGSFTKTLKADTTTEGAENFRVELKTSPTGRVIKYTPPIVINDLSLTPNPTYAVSFNLSSVNEGAPIICTLTTTDLAVGTLVPYTITGISAADIQESLTGNFVVDADGTMTKTFNLVADTLTEGSEILILTLDGVSPAKIVSATINDVSLTPLPCRSAGTPVVFESANTSYTSVTTLDATHALVCYTDGGNGDYGTACVLTTSGSTVTAGTPVVFESAATYHISVTTLDATHALVCYTDGGNGSCGTACVLTTSGSTVTAGTPVVFESATIYYSSVTTLDATHALVCYRGAGNSGYGTACVLTTSGSTVTAGTPVVFESATIYYSSVTTLDATHALVCYMDTGNSSYGIACVLTTSGSTVTAGTPVVFESAATYHISVTTLDATHALVCYMDTGNSSYGTACVLTTSGSTVTAGTPVVFESAHTSYTSVTTLDATHALVCYMDTGNSSYGTACVLTTSGSTITAGTPVVFESANTSYTSVTTLDATHALVCYSDEGSSRYGTACVLY